MAERGIRIIVGWTRVADTIVKVVNPRLGTHSISGTLLADNILRVVVVARGWVLVVLVRRPAYFGNESAIVGSHSLFMIIG